MFMLGAYGQCEQWPFVLDFEIDYASERVRESFSRERKQKQKPSSRKKKMQEMIMHSSPSAYFIHIAFASSII